MSGLPQEHIDAPPGYSSSNYGDKAPAAPPQQPVYVQPQQPVYIQPQPGYVQPQPGFIQTQAVPVYVQPPPNPGMVPTGVLGGNRNVRNLPDGPTGRTWSFGFFDCCGDAATCLLACFFPCFIYGAVKKRYDHLTMQGSPDPRGGSGGYFSGDCCFFCILMHFGCPWVLQMSLRGNVRSRYRIMGGCCGDCCTAFWCAPCDLTRQSRELDLEEGSILGKQ